MNVKNLPNILSFLRLLAAIAFPILFFTLYPNVVPAMILFALAGVTDVLDGFLARKNGWVSDLGKILDPLADKLMQAAVLISLTVKRIIPWWITALYLLKELLMLCGATVVLKTSNTVVVSRWCGKLAALVFYAAMFTLGFFGEKLSRGWVIAICLGTLAVALLALIFYLPDFFRYAGKERKEEEKTSARAQSR